MRAPGGPGATPGWGPGRKQAFGTAPGPTSRVWFTIADGNLSEVFHPTVDRPVLRGMRFIVAAPATPPFDDATEATHEVRWLEPGVPCFRVDSRHPEYSLTTEYIVDPESDALLVSGVFRPELPDVRLYVEAIPHATADGHVLDRHPPALAARLGAASVVFIGPFARCSVGYLNSSDVFVDLHDNDGVMTNDFTVAPRGNVTLGAELATTGGPFQLACGFGRSIAVAEEAAHRSMARGATAVRKNLTRAWRAEPSPDRNVLKVAGDGGALALSSMTLLRCLEDREHPGAFISAPGAPWGDGARTGAVITNRDVFHVATALLDAGDPQSALRALAHFERTQREDGSWPLRYSVSGIAHVEGEGADLGQVALPILLAWRLGMVGALDRDPYPGLVRRAASYLVASGPLTRVDRWMDAGPGLSPSSLAAAIAALVAAAEFAEDAHDTPAAEHLRTVADYWQDSIERWTFSDAERRYVRLAADPEIGARARDAVGLEFLELVRRGLRRADDPRIAASVASADRTLRVSLPAATAWRRYSGDTYGEADDGAPWCPDRPGRGRAWPLLTGERGHLALAAGHPVVAHVRWMEACAGPELILSEQVWDDGERLAQRLEPGRPNGGAAPFGWAHAEYLRLLSAFATSTLPDLAEPVRRRYLEGTPRRPAVVWSHAHRVRQLPAGRRLRVQLRRRASVRWTIDRWATSHVVPARNTGVDCWAADLPTETLAPGTVVEWTAHYTDGRWEGGNHRLTVEAS